LIGDRPVNDRSGPRGAYAFLVVIKTAIDVAGDRIQAVLMKAKAENAAPQG
jgi:hypothetical protein